LDFYPFHFVYLGDGIEINLTDYFPKTTWQWLCAHVLEKILFFFL